MTNLGELRSVLRSMAMPKRAKNNARYFKTGKGQYGYGDKFLGVSVPDARKVSHEFADLSLKNIQTLLLSQFHEERLVALFILVSQFVKGNERHKKKIYEFYLQNTKFINNWDLVDSSAPQIVGEYSLHYDELISSLPQDISNLPTEIYDERLSLSSLHPFSVLMQLVRSENLWERRIAILATFPYIANGEPKLSFEISDLLIDDRNDLIQKALGWMLREVGKRVSEIRLEKYLKTHYKLMGRTTLRYAIEHFTQEKRMAYLKGEI